MLLVHFRHEDFLPLKSFTPSVLRTGTCGSSPRMRRGLPAGPPVLGMWSAVARRSKTALSRKRSKKAAHVWSWLAEMERSITRSMNCTRCGNWPRPKSLLCPPEPATILPDRSGLSRRKRSTRRFIWPARARPVPRWIWDGWAIVTAFSF